MNTDKLQKIINENFEKKEKVNSKSDKKIIKAINETIDLVDQGKIRVANKIDGNWVVNQWIKKAILLSFRVNKMTMSKGPYTTWYDKVPGKTLKWKEKDWKKAGYRHVPNGVVRRGSFIAKNAVLMPSFVNLGAYVDEGTMIDTWAKDKPDLFDAFSCGMVILQVACPSLRKKGSMGGVKRDLNIYGYDAERWRDSLPERRQADFEILDANGGKGWKTVCGLLSQKKGRTSVKSAMGQW